MKKQWLHIYDTLGVVEEDCYLALNIIFPYYYIDILVSLYQCGYKAILIYIKYY